MPNTILNNSPVLGDMMLKSLRRSWSTIAAYTTDIAPESMGGRTAVTVPVVTNATGAEYTTSSTGYTGEDMGVTGITVTPTILYAKWSLNDLERIRNPFNAKAAAMALANGVVNQAFAKLNAVVTAANFSTSSTITAANFDSDDLADLAGTLTATKNAQMERVAILPAGSYHANLMKDGEISAAYASGTTSVILQNTIPVVRGFELHNVTAVANNSQNLGAWVSDKQALCIVARRVDTINGGDVVAVEELTDELSGLPITLVERYVDGNHSITASLLFGVAKGTDTLVRITTA